MKLYSENENYKLYQGSMLNMLEVIDKESIDCVITDPPYELNFMGKGWDNAGVSFQADTWKKCFGVLKDGGYLLAFGGSRTFHRIACAIEDAGFEIRDTIMWLYGSGFPKSMDISKQIDKKLGAEREVIGIRTFADGTKARATARAGIFSEEKGQSYLTAPATDLAKQWQGWGTCLKPSFEPIIIARKPFKGSLVDNVIENGVGGLNIDECRVGNEVITQLQKDMKPYNNNKMGVGYSTKMTGIKTQTVGRFPANTILTYDETDFDEVCGGFPYTKTGSRKAQPQKPENWNAVGIKFKMTYACEGSEGSASRYFYNAKASKKDRDCEGTVRNIHPTCKPTELMQYLVRLVSPKGATILDPFMGSGSTGKAVMFENKERDKNYKFIGIELTEEYLPIAQARIDYVNEANNE